MLLPCWFDPSLVNGVATKFSQHTTQQGIGYDLTPNSKIINDTISQLPKNCP
jgi:hypothetical protein